MTKEVSPGTGDFSLQLQKTSGGFSVTWGGKKVSTEAAFGASVAKVCRQASSLGSDVKKQEHFHRMAQLSVSLGKAQSTKPDATKKEIEVLERARSTALVAALRMVSDEDGQVDLSKLEAEVNELVSARGSQKPKEKEKRVRQLLNIASLLQEAVASGRLAQSAEAQPRALMLAKLALANAISLLPKEIPADVKEEVGRLLAQVALEDARQVTGTQKDLSIEQVLGRIALAMARLKRDYPQFEVLQKMYSKVGKALCTSIANKREQKGALLDKEWETMVDKEIQAFAERCGFAVDKKKLKSSVLEQFATRNFEAVRTACTKPPSPDWYLKMIEAQHVYSAFVNGSEADRERAEEIRKQYQDIYQDMSDRFFTGTTFSVTVQRQQKIVDSHDENPPSGLEKWSRSCASMPIRNTFGRVNSILIGEKEESPSAEHSSGGMLTRAHAFSQAMVSSFAKALEEKGIPKERIPALVNELMMRCCGDASFNYIFSPMSQMLEGVSIQEVDLSTFRPNFVQFRFSVDNQGNLVAQKVYVVQRKICTEAEAKTEYVQCTSTIVMDPNASFDEWTESLETEPYGVALAKEVEERAKATGTTVQEVFNVRKQDLEGQIKNSEERKLVLQDMQAYLSEKRLLPKS